MTEQPGGGDCSNSSSAAGCGTVGVSDGFVHVFEAEGEGEGDARAGERLCGWSGDGVLLLVVVGVCAVR